MFFREGVCTWVCLHCAEEFPKRNPCYAHIKKEHNGIFFRCDKCNYVAVKFEKLVEHKIRIHGEMECFESLKFCIRRKLNKVLRIFGICASPTLSLAAFCNPLSPFHYFFSSSIIITTIITITTIVEFL